MAGGPTTPRLVAAAGSAGALAFLPAGYKSAAEFEREIREVRALTDRPFGINLFVPGRPARDRIAVERYVATIAADAAALGVEVGEARWDDDGWHDKLDVVVAAPPAIVSFAFGCPSRTVVDAFRRRGSIVMVTVTNTTDASIAVDAGADLLCAQGFEAGAHRSTFDDEAVDEQLGTLELVATLRSAIDVPLVAAGGIATAARVRAVVESGAIAAQVGTALLLCDESGTKPAHRAALVDEARTATTMTRAFTGRRARALVNDFLVRHDDAPSAYPEIHHATRPMRVAAAAAGDADRLHLWAGTEFREARQVPVAEAIAELSGRLA